MWAPICNWLFANYPVVIIGLGLIYFTWKLYAQYNRFEKTESALNTHLKDYSEIKPLIHKIDKQLGQLLIYLQAKDTKLKGLIQSNSPIQLTELAKSVLTEYGGGEYLKNNRDLLFEHIRNANPKTSLDVQTVSFSILNQLHDTDGYNKIKEHIYEKPIIKNLNGEDIQLDLSTISYIMSIELRNEYLAINPHIEDLD